MLPAQASGAAASPAHEVRGGVPDLIIAHYLLSSVFCSAWLNNSAVSPVQELSL